MLYRHRAMGGSGQLAINVVGKMMAVHLYVVGYCGFMTRHRGRPPLGDNRRSEVIPVRLTKAERDEIAAASGDASLSAWIRDAALTAAREID